MSRTRPNRPAATLLTADDFPGLSSEAGARFGASVVVWLDDAQDADDCADLLVGAPGTTVAGQAGAGEVYLLRGSPDGLNSVTTTFNEADLGTPGGAQAGAEFGAAIASQTLGTIAIGAPGRDLGSAKDAGRVVWLNYTVSDLPPEMSVIEQGGQEAGTPETGDRFGEVLDLMSGQNGPMVIIGIPHEDIGSKVDAGAVGFIPQSGHLSMVSQDSPGAGGAAESGDRYGAAVEIFGTFTTQPIGVVVIGVPGEDLGATQDAGMISYASFSFELTPEEGVSPIAGRSLTVTQDTPGIVGSVEAGDAYGSAVVQGDFGQDNGQRRLVAASPGEDIGSTRDGGMLAMTRIGEDGRPQNGSQVGGWTQNSAGVSGVVERGDRFGSRLSSVQLTTEVDDGDLIWPVVLVTVPNEDVGSVADAGLAYLGVAPGAGSVVLVPPVLQSGAGLGLVPMTIAID